MIQKHELPKLPKVWRWISQKLCAEGTGWCLLRPRSDDPSDGDECVLHVDRYCTETEARAHTHKLYEEQGFDARDVTNDQLPWTEYPSLKGVVAAYVAKHRLGLLEE